MIPKFELSCKRGSTGQGGKIITGCHQKKRAIYAVSPVHSLGSSNRCNRVPGVSLTVGQAEENDPHSARQASLGWKHYVMAPSILSGSTKLLAPSPLSLSHCGQCLPTAEDGGTSADSAVTDKWLLGTARDSYTAPALHQ